MKKNENYDGFLVVFELLLCFSKKCLKDVADFRYCKHLGKLKGSLFSHFVAPKLSPLTFDPWDFPKLSNILSPDNNRYYVKKRINDMDISDICNVIEFCKECLNEKKNGAGRANYSKTLLSSIKSLLPFRKFYDDADFLTPEESLYRIRNICSHFSSSPKSSEVEILCNWIIGAVCTLYEEISPGSGKKWEKKMCETKERKIFENSKRQELLEEWKKEMKQELAEFQSGIQKLNRICEILKPPEMSEEEKKKRVALLGILVFLTLEHERVCLPYRKKDKYRFINDMLDRVLSDLNLPSYGSWPKRFSDVKENIKNFRELDQYKACEFDFNSEVIFNDFATQNSYFSASNAFMVFHFCEKTKDNFFVVKKEKKDIFKTLGRLNLFIMPDLNDFDLVELGIKDLVDRKYLLRLIHSYVAFFNIRMDLSDKGVVENYAEKLASYLGLEDDFKSFFVNVITFPFYIEDREKFEESIKFFGFKSTQIDKPKERELSLPILFKEFIGEGVFGEFEDENYSTIKKYKDSLEEFHKIYKILEKLHSQKKEEKEKRNNELNGDGWKKGFF